MTVFRVELSLEVEADNAELAALEVRQLMDDEDESTYFFSVYDEEDSCFEVNLNQTTEIKTCDWCANHFDEKDTDAAHGLCGHCVRDLDKPDSEINLLQEEEKRPQPYIIRSL